MDAITYLKEKERMCNHYFQMTPRYCPCTIEGEKYSGCNCVTLSPEQLVLIVEKWSNENPIITNRMKFKEMFGGLFSTPEANQNHCIYYQNGLRICDNTKICFDCGWWDEEYKGDEINNEGKNI